MWWKRPWKVNICLPGNCQEILFLCSTLSNRGETPIHFITTQSSSEYSRRSIHNLTLDTRLGDTLVHPPRCCYTSLDPWPPASFSTFFRQNLGDCSTFLSKFRWLLDIFCPKIQWPSHSHSSWLPLSFSANPGLLGLLIAVSLHIFRCVQCWFTFRAGKGCSKENCTPN